MAATGRCETSYCEEENVIELYFIPTIKMTDDEFIWPKCPECKRPMNEVFVGQGQLLPLPRISFGTTFSCSKCKTVEIVEGTVIRGFTTPKTRQDEIVLWMRSHSEKERFNFLQSFAEEQYSVYEKYVERKYDDYLAEISTKV